MNSIMASKRKISITIVLLTAVLVLLVVFSICLGKYPVSPKESLSILFRAATFKEQLADSMTVNVVLRLRLPRILVSIFVGAALSISGACYQSIFQNPLVSPDFLGVSSGACIGAAVAILLGLSSAFISGFAFIGGILAVLITASIPALIKNRSNIMLVLSGIIVGSLMSSILGFIKFVADPQTQLASITYWTMGDFSYASNADLLPMVIVLVPPMIILLLMSWWMDVLSMGQDEARTLGANVKLVRGVAIVCSTLLTAGSICFAGSIGWVGLIVPHFVRMLVGSSNRRVLPVSCLIGGIFMLVVDTLTRLIGAAEMPVSIMTGIIGAPFFCWLLFKKRNEIA
ncbi:MAG: iron ABC transporter permease [Clostridia bacterium]|nr:iron ABC transporter permease [Clostridia bacterium]